jgi:TonB family protein
MKKLVFGLILVLSACCVKAQDVIVKKDNSTILSKVTKVSQIEIEYKKWSNLDGPIYIVPISEVLRINYENGEYDEFVGEQMEANNESLDGDVFLSVEENPEFPGGPAKLLEYIQKNLEYPEAARENEIQGRVFVGFIVEEDGSVSNVKILRGIGYGCDEEAIRLVNSLPKFKPGKQRGKPIRVQYTLPIVFKLK